MSILQTYKGNELPLIIRLLTVFGVVEQRQLRMLMDHMSNDKYGKLLSVLKRDGLVYFSSDGKFISTSRYTMDHHDLKDSVPAFWTFIYLRNQVLDFCAAEPPSLLTFSAVDRDYDLVPGRPENIPSINEQASGISADTIRFIIVNDLDAAEALEKRAHGDYLVLADTDGVTQIYQL